MSDPTGTSKLKWKIFVPPAVATVNDDLPPGETARVWSPTSSILIHGERDAILVDTPPCCYTVMFRRFGKRPI